MKIEDENQSFTKKGSAESQKASYRRIQTVKYKSKIWVQEVAPIKKF